MSNVLLIHGILGILAWGILVPSSLFMTVFRTLLFRPPLWERLHHHRRPCSGSATKDQEDRIVKSTEEDIRTPPIIENQSWVKLHRYINETVLLLTLILFILAVVGVQDKKHHQSSSAVHPTNNHLNAILQSRAEENDIGHRHHHFHNAHEILGLIIVVATLVLWGVGRLVMPAKQSKMAKQQRCVASDSPSSATETTVLLMMSPERNDDLQQSGYNNVMIPETSNPATTTDSHHRPTTTKEYVLVWCHRILGGTVAVMALWEVYSGMCIYNHQQKGTSYVIAFYVYLYWISLVFVCFAVSWLCLVRKSQRQQQQQQQPAT